ncbi:ABC transporter ATP-binding protein [Petrocella sp. FN5]|uniref:ABC transporter ATP-binding protein n=1 Tax=Petrocella sp. FN5 TaxID=3032002 RepID=UPI0023DCE425|nr:ABC transporter ATP-binding protein [Petrocella sp. FN5]MDF1617273.1 ABC transporter ATP-binding protein [Petrocella sp. FN5]
MIRLDNVSKIYGMNNTQVTALKNINLNIFEGDYVSISGTSGSGKSTLMNIIGCLDSPTAGNYFFEGVPINTIGQSELSTIRNKYIGFVFQSFFLIPGLTALENVILPLFYGGKGKKECIKKAREVLELMDLGDRIHHDSTELSGGQKQRTSIARALVTNPKILLADEPTGNLDSKNTREIMGLFKDLNKKGMTVVLITHDERYANMANKRYKIEDGILQEA